MSCSPRCEVLHPQSPGSAPPELFWELCPTGQAQGTCSTAGLELPRKCPVLPSSSRCWELTTLIQTSTRLPSGSAEARPVSFSLLPFPGEKGTLGGEQELRELSLADTCSALGAAQTCTYFTLPFTRSRRAPQRPAQPCAAGACQHMENVNNPAGKSPPALPIPAPADAPAWLSSAAFPGEPCAVGSVDSGVSPPTSLLLPRVREEPLEPLSCAMRSAQAGASALPPSPGISLGGFALLSMGKAMGRRGTAEGQPHRAEHQLSAG